MATKTLKEYEDFRSGIDTSHEGDYLDFINGTNSGGTPYTLTPAAVDTLGGVKVPADGGIAVDAEGAITLKLSNAFDIDGTGALILNGGGGGGGGGSYSLPAASASVLGGVKVGTGLAIDGSGVLSATGGGSTASGDSITKTFTKAAHGFTFGQAISRSPSGWVLGSAATDTNAEISGIVSAVTADTFTLTLMGYMSGFAGLVDGSTYYLSDTTAGVGRRRAWVMD